MTVKNCFWKMCLNIFFAPNVKTYICRNLFSSFLLFLLAGIHGIREGEELTMMAIEELILVLTSKCAILFVGRKSRDSGFARKHRSSHRLVGEHSPSHWRRNQKGDDHSSFSSQPSTRRQVALTTRQIANSSSSKFKRLWSFTGTRGRCTWAATGTHTSHPM